MKDIIITLPANIPWSEYKKELAKVEDGKEMLNFKVPFLPKEVELNKSKCYLVHKGFIVGHMLITGLSKGKFTCSTTGNTWDGNFIQRSGPFTYLEKPIPYKGFQGFRYANN